MEEKTYVLLSLEDEGAKKLAGVLGNKSCKKIIDYLAEVKEASEKDISDAVDSPINTVEYNLKKLLEAGLVEKTKSFFWSKKGKKIPTYRLSNKSIIISPKASVSSKIKSILPVALVSVVGALIVRFFYTSKEVGETTAPEMLKSASEAADSAISAGLNQINSVECINLMPKTQMSWEWFLIGAVFALGIFLLINWRKSK
jgi:DNA-binding transcriptional ArsR family regulator